MAMVLGHDEVVHLTEEEAREEDEMIREIVEEKDRKMAEQLRDLYWNKKLSIYEVAARIGCSTHKVWDLMRKYNIQRRSIGEGKRLAYTKTIESGKIKPLFTKEELIDLYQKQGMSRREIASRKGCNVNAVSYWLRKYGIPARSYSEAGRLWYKKKSRFEEGSISKERWQNLEYIKMQIEKLRRDIRNVETLIKDMEKHERKEREILKAILEEVRRRNE